MVMSGSKTDEDESPLEWAFQNHKKALLRRGNHPRSNFRRTILDGADLTEGNFVDSDFRRASMPGADLMKSAFDNCDFRGADLRKARLNLSNFRNCQFEGADIRTKSSGSVAMAYEKNLKEVGKENPFKTNETFGDDKKKNMKIIKEDDEK